LINIWVSKNLSYS